MRAAPKRLTGAASSKVRAIAKLSIGLVVGTSTDRSPTDHAARLYTTAKTGFMKNRSSKTEDFVRKVYRSIVRGKLDDAEGYAVAGGNLDFQLPNSEGAWTALHHGELKIGNPVAGCFAAGVPQTTSTAEYNSTPTATLQHSVHHRQDVYRDLAIGSQR